MKYIIEIFFNETDSCLLHDVLYISFIGDIVKIDRMFDEPIFDLKEVLKVEIKQQK